MSLLLGLQALIAAQGSYAKETRARALAAYGRVGADFSWNSTTLVDIPNLTFDVPAGLTYEFKVRLFSLQANAAGDMRYQINAPGASGRWTIDNLENAVSRSYAYNTASLNVPVATGTDDQYQISGIITAAVATTVQIQIRNNAGTNTQTISGESFLTARKLA